jgi:hypothetical protein
MLLDLAQELGSNEADSMRSATRPAPGCSYSRRRTGAAIDIYAQRADVEYRELLTVLFCEGVRIIAKIPHRQLVEAQFRALSASCRSRSDGSAASHLITNKPQRQRLLVGSQINVNP